MPLVPTFKSSSSTARPDSPFNLLPPLPPPPPETPSMTFLLLPSLIKPGGPGGRQAPRGGAGRECGPGGVSPGLGPARKAAREGVLFSCKNLWCFFATGNDSGMNLLLSG